MMKEVVTKTNGTEKIGVRVCKFFNRNYITIATLTLVLVAMVGATCFGATADALWTTLTGIIKTWINRLGAVVVFVGGIIFALGWKSDDAEQKSRGISTIIAGALVMAIANITATFFA